jgi:thiol-disulfide isomerase/thioredoxin
MLRSLLPFLPPTTFAASFGTRALRACMVSVSIFVGLPAAAAPAETSPEPAKAPAPPAPAPAPELRISHWFTRARKGYTPNRVTLVVFWEAWCPACQRELPRLPGLQDRWSPRGLDIVTLTGFSEGWSQPALEKFIRAHGLKQLAIGMDERGSTATAFKVPSIPYAALVADGVVHWTGSLAAMTDENLDKMLVVVPSKED